MRLEKKFISAEYVARLNASPFFLVVDYRGMSVGQFNELRKRLRPSGSELHVVKSTIFRVAVQEVGLADLAGTLSGQIAIVTGLKDVAAAAKAVKNYQAEFAKPKLQFGYLGNQRISVEELRIIADLPPLAELQGKILGLLQAPAQKLVALINTPGSQLARVIKAKADKAE
jgi:large subunit ribosomal protein L10